VLEANARRVFEELRIREQDWGTFAPQTRLVCMLSKGSCNANRAPVGVRPDSQDYERIIMSFFGKLFSRRPQPDKGAYAQAMEEMANEAERTHRGMVSVYNNEVAAGLLPPTIGDAAAAPTGRGVYKARLFGALFMAYAFARSGASESDRQDIMNVASGFAMMSVQGPEEPSLARSEAAHFTIDFIKAVLPAIDRAMRNGPGMPGSPSVDLNALADHLHDALAESIGQRRYTDAVRVRFAVAVQANVMAAMNHTSKWLN